jgi:TatD DNase family protein
MNLFDTHCHLYLADFAPDITEVIQRAAKEGVQKFFLPAIDKASNADLLKLEGAFPGKCFAMTGLHPCSVNADFLTELKLVEESLEKRKYVGIGETGLDFYWDRSFEKEQYSAFRQQVEWAMHYRLPVIIHSRESMEQTIEVINDYQNGNLKGIFHCFSGSPGLARKIIDMGFYLGIGGVITYKNAGLAESIKDIDLKYLVLETDAPYLSPVPFRGKRNESGYLKYIVEKLSEVKEISKEEVAEITTANAIKIFGN